MIKVFISFNQDLNHCIHLVYDQTNWTNGANKITIKYSDFTTVIWKKDGDKYSRFIIDNYSDVKEPVAHNYITQDKKTDILQTESIVVIQGPLYKDIATTLPSVLTVGVGKAYVFHNGKYIKGTWRRGDITESFVLLDKIKIKLKYHQVLSGFIFYQTKVKF